MSCRVGDCLSYSSLFLVELSFQLSQESRRALPFLGLLSSNHMILDFLPLCSRLNLYFLWLTTTNSLLHGLGLCYIALNKTKQELLRLKTK